jgi:Fe2+ transport system protein FeoA
MNITQLAAGRRARVIEIQGGRQTAGKLEALGIVPGAIVAKKSAALMHGPIVLVKGLMSVAIGFGMAKKIIIKPVEQ